MIIKRSIYRKLWTKVWVDCLLKQHFYRFNIKYISHYNATIVLFFLLYALIVNIRYKETAKWKIMTQIQNLITIIRFVESYLVLRFKNGENLAHTKGQWQLSIIHMYKSSFFVQYNIIFVSIYIAYQPVIYQYIL